jgi:hypothetical protein
LTSDFIHVINKHATAPSTEIKLGVRETLNRNKSLTVAVTGAAIFLGVGLFLWNLNSSASDRLGTGNDFITTDDGKTFSLDSSQELPPFTVNGKTAYRAYVYTCDGGKTKWVGYIQRYTPEGKKLALKMREQQRTAKGPPQLNPTLLENIEIKRPGDAQWVRQSDLTQASRIADVKCPHNAAETPELLIP